MTLTRSRALWAVPDISMDVLTAQQRHHCMSRIKGKNTKPELTLRGHLWSLGFRYRLHYKLPGKPDLVFVKARIAVFVDGCFWHCCPIHLKIPGTNTEFWSEKLNRNRSRDISVSEILESNGWNVLRIWEHEIKNDVEAVAIRIGSLLT